MSEQSAFVPVKVTLEAVVTRADGTVEDLGTLAEYNRDEPERNKGRIRFSNRIRSFLNG